MDKITLSDFGPSSVWFVSVGIPTGETIDLEKGVDPDTGETYEIDPWDAQAMVPFSWELNGTIENGVWCWDGKGRPRDWNRNSVQAINAFK